MPTHGWRHGLPCIAPSGAIPKWRGRADGSIRGQKFLSRRAILFNWLLTEKVKCGILQTINKSFVSRFGARRPRKDAGACSRSFGSRVCLGIFFALALAKTRARCPCHEALTRSPCHVEWAWASCPCLTVRKFAYSVHIYCSGILCIFCRSTPSSAIFRRVGHVHRRFAS